MSSNNLPVLLTSFIGREYEIAEARNLLQKTHLLTFTGAGGSGKTRLALAVSRELINHYQDGIWFVELASLTDPALVYQAVAAVLDVYEAPGRPLAESLVVHLKSKQLLLILDNCEHLIDACARMAYDLLLASPGLQILATSREPLHIAGEVTWLVPPLPLPNPEQHPGLDELVTYGAISLFVERAKSVLPSFSLDNANALAVSQVCSRLGGIPLAIELAAASVRFLTPEAIASRLEGFIQLPAGSNRFSPTRHQTLQAALDWSYDLLQDHEQVLFRRLSVFVGGFRLEAAEAVCAGGPELGMGAAGNPELPSSDIQPENILDLLARLVDKSLVLVERETAHGQRFRLLEPVRQYSSKKLVESGEAEWVRDRHFAWYLDLVEKAAPELSRSQRRSWIELLEQENPNIRIAFDWSLVQPQRSSLGARMGSALSQFWQPRGYFSEGLERLEKILSRSTELPDADLTTVLECAGFLAVHLRDTERAKKYLGKALQLSHASGNRSGIALQKRLLGWTAAQEGDFELALKYCEESLTLNREIGDPWRIAGDLLLLGDLSYIRGDIVTARLQQEESLSLSRQSDYALAIPRRLTRLGQIACIQGELERATSFFEESLRLSRDGGDNWSVAMALAGLAGLAKTLGQPKRAAILLGATQSFLETFATALWPLDRMEYEKNISEVRALLGEKEFQAAWNQGTAYEIRDVDQLILFALSEPDESFKEAARMPQQPGQQHLTALQAARRESGGLTRREREVVVLIVQGKSNSEISATLFVGLRTVEAHVTHILNKLGFTSRAQIAAWAVDKGLASPPQVSQDYDGMD